MARDFIGYYDRWHFRRGGPERFVGGVLAISLVADGPLGGSGAAVIRGSEPRLRTKRTTMTVAAHMEMSWIGTPDGKPFGLA